MIGQLISSITKALSRCPSVKGIVLGGSRATQTAAESSDIDIGIYYDRAALDYDMLNAAARELDDAHRENLICHEGEWGGWVNCGGWLTVGGIPVDLILRDISRIKECLNQTDAGVISCHYQTGHPHAYLNVMYRGELASGKLLYAENDEFRVLKQRAEAYPEPMRKALLSSFLFEADFSCALAKKSLGTRELYYTVGHLFRSISALNQVLFALGRVYCLNEKKATLRIENFPVAPKHYRSKVERILSVTPETSAASVSELEQLCCDVRQLYENDCRMSAEII